MPDQNSAINNILNTNNIHYNVFEIFLKSGTMLQLLNQKNN